MNVVSIMAHADDEMRCLGTMLKCRVRGDRLFFVTLTDGSKGFVQNPGIAREEAARIRHGEMTALADGVDASYTNLGEPDEFLYDTPEVRMKLIEAIRQTGAQLIFTHFSEDYNLDHTTVNRLVRHCAMQACLPVLPTLSAPLKDHPAIFMCEPFGTFDFPASHYVDISTYHAEKMRLLLNPCRPPWAPAWKLSARAWKHSAANWPAASGPNALFPCPVAVRSSRLQYCHNTRREWMGHTDHFPALHPKTENSLRVQVNPCRISIHIPGTPPCTSARRRCMR
jgi:LmbE family N-acetylglucosaminyl deacetylase